jgi:hypothetical protein
MTPHELTARVRELRAARYTPKEIAAALGIAKAEATRLVRAVAAEGAEAAQHDGGSEPSCWVSPGWSGGLRVRGRAGWPTDHDADAEAASSGLVTVLLGVQQRRDRVSMSCFLVDTWCLGVKNASGPKPMSPQRFAAHRREVFSPWASEAVAVPLELARHLVLGAAEFARGLGFRPHSDFARARVALGQLEEPCAIEFGRDGRPFYSSGPYDDPEAILARLTKLEAAA